MQLVIIVCFLIAGLVVSKFNILIAGVFLVGAPFGFMLLSKPRALFYILFLWVSLTPNFILLFGLGYFSYVDEVLSLLLVGVLILHILMRRATFFQNKIVAFSFFGFLFVYLSSLLWNHHEWFNGVRFFLSYGRPFVVFAYVYNFFSGEDLKRFLRALVILIGIQWALNTLWMLNLIPHYRNYLDKSTGTFETCATTAYFFCMVLLVVIALFANEKNNRQKILLGVIFVLSIVQIFFTFTNHAYFLFAFGLASFAIVSLRKYSKIILNPHILIGVAMFVVLFFSFEGIIRKKTHSSSLGITTSVFQKEALHRRVDRLKYESLKYHLFDITFSGEVPEIGLFGAGPGALFSTVAYRSVTPLVMRYVGSYFFSIDASSREAASVTGHPYSAMLAIIGDLGFFALFGYGVFYFILFSSVLRFVHSGRHESSEFPALFEAFVPCLIFYLLAEVVWDLTSFKVISVGFWAWGALLLREMDRLKTVDSDSGRQVSVGWNVPGC